MIQALFIFFLFALSTLYPSRLLAAQKDCPPGESRYRPGGDCEKESPVISPNLPDYPLTCLDVPLAELNRTTYIPTLPGIEIANIVTDVSQAETGGLGPNAQVINQFSPDVLSRIYPFAGLFDKPISSKDQPRESSRTYWRLLSANQQANAKALFIKRVEENNPPINNTSIIYNTKSSDVVGEPVPRHTATPPKKQASYAKPASVCSEGQVDLLDFFISDDPNRISVMESGETFQTYQTTIGGRPGFVLVKSRATDHFEEFTYDDQYIYHLRDTTWENTCDGGYAYYSVFDPSSGAEGGQAAKRCMAPGETSSQSFQLRAYNRDSCSPCRVDFGHSVNTGGSYQMTLSADGQTLELNQLTGPGAGEIKTYGKGKGLVGFKDAGKFSSGNKVKEYQTGDLGEIVNTCTTTTTPKSSMTIKELASRLPGCLKSYPVCTDFQKEYLNLNPTTRAAYDALLPFNFDNIRGYMVLNDTLVKENLPYAQAINDGLNNPQAGLLNTLSPQWVNDQRSFPFLSNSVISSLLEGPLLPLAKLRALSLNPNDCLNHKDAVYLPAPLTYPQNSDGGQPKFREENVRIQTSVSIETDKETGKKKYIVTGQKEGQPVAVLNSPILENISSSIAKGAKSLFNLLLPASFQGFRDRDLVAPIGGLSSEAPDVKVSGQTKGEGQTPIGRTGGEAHTKLCELRNQWLIPESLQNQYLDCTNPQLVASTSLSSSSQPQQGTCTVPTGTLCAPDNPVTRLKEIFKDQAENAAQVCKVESGGSPSAINDGCLKNPVYNKVKHTADYSVGLFQLNLLFLPNPKFFDQPEAQLLKSPSPYKRTLPEIMKKYGVT
ncbi:hypothetical protein HY333_01560, partial [Candidatus Collierbacteria bacterium]|nr:hypothetical protein [Candidatus Collierbacteria bacterium]